LTGSVKLCYKFSIRNIIAPENIFGNTATTIPCGWGKGEVPKPFLKTKKAMGAKGWMAEGGLPGL
jgi:hypothetical protein